MPSCITSSLCQLFLYYPHREKLEKQNILDMGQERILLQLHFCETNIKVSMWTVYLVYRLITLTKGLIFSGDVTRSQFLPETDLGNK